MSDNEKVKALQDSLLRDINVSTLPLSVKALTLENLFLRVEMAMQVQRSSGMNDDNAADT